MTGLGFRRRSLDTSKLTHDGVTVHLLGPCDVSEFKPIARRPSPLIWLGRSRSWLKKPSIT